MSCFSCFRRSEPQEVSIPPVSAERLLFCGGTEEIVDIAQRELGPYLRVVSVQAANMKTTAVIESGHEHDLGTREVKLSSEATRDITGVLLEKIGRRGQQVISFRAVLRERCTIVIFSPGSDKSFLE